MVVKSSLHLSIGAVNFRISGRESSIHQDYDPAYKQFLAKDSSTKAQNVSIRLLSAKDMPDLAVLAKIFDTPRSWSMYKSLDSRYIAFNPTSSNEPEWMARIGADRHNIDVFCKNPLNPVRYPLDQLLLIHLLAGNGLLMHAAGMVIDNKGYLFAGPSGAGKSTICSLFIDVNNCLMLSDDRIVVRQSEKDLFMYGTPWPGEAGIAVSDSAKLRGIFFLRHGVKNHIRELQSGETLDYLFKVASLPWYDEADIEKSLDFCNDLLNQVKAYEMNFRPGPEIIKDFISFVSG